MWNLLGWKTFREGKWTQDAYLKAAKLGNVYIPLTLGQGGTPFPWLAAIMGWSPATTARMAKRYGHVSTESLREDVAILDRHSGLRSIESAGA